MIMTIKHRLMSRLTARQPVDISHHVIRQLKHSGRFKHSARSIETIIHNGYAKATNKELFFASVNSYADHLFVKGKLVKGQAVKDALQRQINAEDIGIEQSQVYHSPHVSMNNTTHNQGSLDGSDANNLAFIVANEVKLDHSLAVTLPVNEMVVPSNLSVGDVGIGDEECPNPLDALCSIFDYLDTNLIEETFFQSDCDVQYASQLLAEMSYGVTFPFGETDYRRRLAQSRLLVIGASGYHNEDRLFAPFDANYMPIGNDFLDISPIQRSPLTKRWDSDQFWPNLNRNLENHLFRFILLDGGVLHHMVHAEAHRQGHPVQDRDVRLYQPWDYILSMFDRSKDCLFYIETFTYRSRWVPVLKDKLLAAGFVDSTTEVRFGDDDYNRTYIQYTRVAV